MARAWPITAVYLIAAWALMVSYQIFTQSALTTMAASLSATAPLVSSWLSSSSASAGFICAFAWMFVLSEGIEQLMFGKERRLSIRFLISLGLTLAGSTVLGLLQVAGLDLANPSVLSPFALLFGNVVFAWFYVALPFIFMLWIDFRYIRKKKK